MYCNPLGESLALRQYHIPNAYLRILCDTMRKGQRHERSETVRLVDDGLHIGEVLSILVRRKARVADDVVKLCMRLFLHMRVRSQNEDQIVQEASAGLCTSFVESAAKETER